MKVMISKFAGPCCNCDERIKAGQTIKFFGRGCASHFDCDKATARPADDDCTHADENDEGDECFPHSEIANDRRLARQGLSVTRFSSGAVHTQNSRGRCEDAPCCGCCD